MDLIETLLASEVILAVIMVMALEFCDKYKKIIAISFIILEFSLLITLFFGIWVV
jgi:hypothetical protein